MQKSKCCQAEIITAHGCDSDFGHAGKCDCEIVTSWYECTKCKNPCDPQFPPSNPVREEGARSFGKTSRALMSFYNDHCKGESTIFCTPKGNIYSQKAHDDSVAKARADERKKIHEEVQALLDETTAGEENNDFIAAQTMWRGLKRILLNTKE